MAVVSTERIVDKLRELEARVRALERQADDNRTLEDIRCSISMLSETVVARQPPAATAPRDSDGFTALTNSRYWTA